MKNFIRKSLGAFSLMVFFVGLANAQTACDLTAKSAALLLDLRIGMSPADAQAAVGKDLKIKIKKSGERTFFQNFIKKPAPASLRGVRAVYLRFFDRRLYQIEIFYEPRTNLTTLDDVTVALAAELNLAATDWKIENNRANIVCGEISLVADAVLNPRIELTDETVLAAIEERRKKDKD